jgi:hemerythrin superfamily protein
MRDQNSKGRTAAILMGGIAGGMLLGRLLPPIITAMASAARTRAGGDPFGLLIEDHRKILMLLDRMVEEQSGSKFRRGSLFLALKRKLAKHAMAEEDVVYPIVRKQMGHEDQGKHLYDEHADMKILLYDIEARLMAGEDWSAPVGQLRDLIRSHVDEEENVIFPELRRQVAEATLPMVSGQISREEALVV